MAEDLVLVDSSIWIRGLRPAAPEDVRSVLGRLIEDRRAAMAPIIRLEILAGARTGSEFEGLRADLEAIPCLEITRREWHRAEDVGFSLGRAGRRAAAADLLIAAVAISHGVPLWHADEDFARIQRVVGIGNFKTFWHPKRNPPV